MEIPHPLIYNLCIVIVFRSLPIDSSIRSSSLSSTRSDSDAQSAPPELDQLFDHICEKSAELLRLKNTELPPGWNIPDLIRALLGNETLQMPGYLQDTYYDVLLRGETSWLFEDISNFIDLIHYAL